MGDIVKEKNINIGKVVNDGRNIFFLFWCDAQNIY